jgi:hypothetical protein
MDIVDRALNVSGRSLARDVVPGGVILYPESGDLDHFVGDTADFTIDDSTPVLFNDLSLKQTTKADNETVAIGSNTGLRNYPKAGQTVSGYVYSNDGQTAPQFYWGVQTPTDLSSSGSHYSWFLDFRDGSQRIVIRVDGATQSNSTISVTPETWYEVKLEWGTDGTIVVSVYEVNQNDGGRQSFLQSTTHTDSSYTNGGIGFADAAGEGLPIFDSFTIV